MVLKFPLEKPLFSPLDLSTQECKDYAHLTDSLVDQAIKEYGVYVNVLHRQLDRKQWRVVKSRENVTAYGERSQKISSSARARQQSARSTSLRSSQHPFRPEFASVSGENGEHWDSPNLLGVGTIAGTLDDAMYGVATFDAVSMLLKTTYTKDGILDGEVLCPIEGPSASQPYRFLGIKWMAVGGGPGADLIVWPRDYVFVEASGIRTLENGERIGYHIIHSVDLPGYGALSRKPVVRGRLSSCYLYKQLPNTTVDVYMKTSIDANTKNVPDAITQRLCATGLLYCWKVVVCSQNKKLVRLVMKNRKEQRGGSPPQSATTAVKCTVCRKTLGKLNRVDTCQLCSASVCSRCCVAKKLSFVGSGVKQVNRMTVVFCSSCITQSNQTSAFEIAREEVLTGRWAMLPSLPRLTTTLYSMKDSIRLTEENEASGVTVESSLVATASAGSSFDTAIKLETESVDDEDTKSEVQSSIDDELQKHTTSTAVFGDGKPLTYQQQLWLQISELCATAEKVYQYTQETTREHVA